MQKVLAKSKHSVDAGVLAGHNRCRYGEDGMDQAYPPGWRSVCLPTLPINDVVLRPATEVPVYLFHRRNGPKAAGVLSVRDACNDSVDRHSEVVSSAHDCPNIALSA